RARSLAHRSLRRAHTQTKAKPLLPPFFAQPTPNAIHERHGHRRVAKRHGCCGGDGGRCRQRRAGGPAPGGADSGAAGGRVHLRCHPLAAAAAHTGLAHVAARRHAPVPASRPPQRHVRVDHRRAQGARGHVHVPRAVAHQPPLRCHRRPAQPGAPPQDQVRELPQGPLLPRKHAGPPRRRHLRRRRRGVEEAAQGGQPRVPLRRVPRAHRQLARRARPPPAAPRAGRRGGRGRRRGPPGRAPPPHVRQRLHDRLRRRPGLPPPGPPRDPVRPRVRGRHRGDHRPLRHADRAVARDARARRRARARAPALPGRRRRVRVRRDPQAQGGARRRRGRGRAQVGPAHRVHQDARRGRAPVHGQVPPRHLRELHPGRPRHLVCGARVVLLAARQEPRRGGGGGARVQARGGEADGVPPRRALRGAPPLPVRPRRPQGGRGGRGVPGRDGAEEGHQGDLRHVLHGADGEHLGRRLPRVQAGAVAPGRTLRGRVRLQVHGLQRRPAPVPRQGLRLLPDEVHRRLHPPPLPRPRRRGPPRRAQDGAHHVHEARAQGDAHQERQGQLIKL
uniref:Uncharacterized protein n=1 Tax=Zea mays TaxID=4577 RepID=A0A804U6N5_MAIZE